jgi:dienelactone hydrolase
MVRTKEQPTRRHSVTTTAVNIAADGVSLDGDLAIPKNAVGLILFAHGSGSSRLSPRNRYVAEYFHDNKISTLLFDLLTPDEEAVDMISGELRFDIDLLSRRLLAATEWARKEPATAALALGYFGASTGAAAALVAASIRQADVKAIVSRGGRPDLAGAALAAVRAPTLLIVGGDDEEVIEMNRAAAAQLTAPHTIEIVPGATHLFEEPGKLDVVARLAARWFADHLI